MKTSGKSHNKFFIFFLQKMFIKKNIKKGATLKFLK